MPSHVLEQIQANCHLHMRMSELRIKLNDLRVNRSTADFEPKRKALAQDAEVSSAGGVHIPRQLRFKIPFHAEPRQSVYPEDLNCDPLSLPNKSTAVLYEFINSGLMITTSTRHTNSLALILKWMCERRIICRTNYRLCGWNR